MLVIGVERNAGADICLMLIRRGFGKRGDGKRGDGPSFENGFTNFVRCEDLSSVFLLRQTWGRTFV